MKIARVFPRKTNMSPEGKDVYFSEPGFFTPQYDEIHISCLFTWDIKRAKYLAEQWQEKGKVKIGGVAFSDPGGEFTPGIYVRKGVVITSRGCPNKCFYCFVPKREGKLRELKKIHKGNNIIDNNFLACSKLHRDKVFKMLKTQSGICFSGGLEPVRITDEIVEQLRGLKIYQIFLSYDIPVSDKQLIKAVNKLKEYFSLNQIRCYVLIGYKGDTIEKAEVRCRRVFEIGALPFAQRFRTASTDWNDSFLFKQKKWNLLAREWSRPAIMKAKMKETK